MANVNAPFGLRPIGTMGAGANFELRTVKIAYGDTQAIYRGDPVKLLGTGYVAAWTATTEVSQFAGVFYGCRILSTLMKEIIFSPYWPGSGTTSDVEAVIIPVNLAVPQKFIIQTDGAAATAFASNHANADFTMGTGNAFTGQSGASLATATFGTAATLPVRIMEQYRGVGNGSDHTTGYNWLVVSANSSGAGSTGLA